MYSGTQRHDRIETLLRELSALPEGMRVAEALSVAAASVEFAAYEMAQTSEAKQVAQLILFAADLERVAEAARTSRRQM